MRPKLSQKFKPDSVHCCNFYLNVFFCCENINWKKKFNTFSSCLGQYLQQTFKTGISASVVSKRGPKVNLKRNVCFVWIHILNPYSANSINISYSICRYKMKTSQGKFILLRGPKAIFTSKRVRGARDFDPSWVSLNESSKQTQI